MTYSEDTYEEYIGVITGFISLESYGDDEIILAHFITGNDENYILNLLPTLPKSEYSLDYNNIKEVIRPLFNKNIIIKAKSRIKINQKKINIFEGYELHLTFLSGMLLTDPIPVYELPEKEQLKIKKLKEKISAWEEEEKKRKLKETREEIASWFGVFSDYAQTDDEKDIF